MTPLRERLRDPHVVFSETDVPQRAADVLDALVAMRPMIDGDANNETNPMDGPRQFWCSVCGHMDEKPDQHFTECWLRDLLALIDQVER